MQWSIEEYMKQGHATSEEQDRRISSMLAERMADVQKELQLQKKLEGTAEEPSSIAETTRRIQQLTKQAAEEVNESKIF